MYYSFEFDMPTRVLFGEGKLNELHDEKLPGTKALIVTTNGTSVKKYGGQRALQCGVDVCGGQRLQLRHFGLQGTEGHAEVQ